LIHRHQRDFHDRKHYWKSFRVSVSITSRDSVWISSMLSKRRPLNFNFNFGNKKNHRCRDPVSRGGGGMTAVFVETTNCRTTSDMWAGALS
jgi:hypothetical protein